MPTYDYECNACGHDFELFQSMTDPVKRKCPECGKHRLQRLFGTGAAVVFKGSGFYQTDYRSESYRKGAEAAKKAKSDSGGDSGKSSNTKKKSTETATSSSS
jgi:putative FmdB family regulatory protein